MKAGTSYKTDLQDFLLGKSVVFDSRYDKDSMYGNLLNQLKSQFQVGKTLCGWGYKPRNYDEYANSVAKDVLSRDIFNNPAELEAQTHEGGKTLYWVLEDGFLPGALKLYEIFKGMDGIERLFDTLDSVVQGDAGDNYDLTIHVLRDVPNSARFDRMKSKPDYVVMTFDEYLQFKPFGNPLFWRLGDMKSYGFNDGVNEMQASFDSGQTIIYDNGIFKRYEQLVSSLNDNGQSDILDILDDGGSLGSVSRSLELLKFAKLKFNFVRS